MRKNMKRMLAVLTAVLLVCSTTSAYAQTTVRGRSRGFGGEVIADVTVDENGKILELTLTAENETPGIGTNAIEPMTAAILEAGNEQVDSVAGATVTSNAIRSAVKAAMAEAGFGKSNSEIRFTPGTYTGTAVGRIAEVTVEVTVTEERIEKIEVIKSQETEGISDLPKARIPQEIITYQSLGVDIVTGATSTSYALINAVSDALAQAGADVDALRAVPVEKDIPSVENMKTQIVVAGGGMSGLMAAATAADKGAEVILVEKLSFLGGSLIVAGGGLVTVDSKLYDGTDRDDGLENVMDFVYAVNETSERKQDYDFTKYMLQQSGITVDYIAENFNMTPSVYGNPAYTVTIFDGNGNGEVKGLARVLADKGVKVLLDTEAKEIVMEDGNAVGLKVQSAGGEFIIEAEKVIIATGGASWDKERMVAANPELAYMFIDEQAMQGNTGDGFRMLEEIGAKKGENYDPIIKNGTVCYAPEFHFTWMTNPGTGAKLIVDDKGERFANEAPLNFTIFTRNMFRHGSEYYYAFFDEAHTSESFLPLLKQEAEKNNPKVAVYGKTIEEVAEKLSMDEQVLVATYNRYQELCLAGEDIDFGKDANNMVAYDDEKGIYAVLVRPSSWGTMGGVLTDNQFHVLHEDDTPIENVFAVGETATSTLFGDYYHGSFSLSYYATAGRIAAETAVAEINAK